MAALLRLTTTPIWSAISGTERVFHSACNLTFFFFFFGVGTADTSPRCHSKHTSIPNGEGVRKRWGEDKVESLISELAPTQTVGESHRSLKLLSRKMRESMAILEKESGLFCFNFTLVAIFLFLFPWVILFLHLRYQSRKPSVLYLGR